MKGLRRLIKFVLFTLLCLLVALPLLLYGVLGSETGTRWFFDISQDLAGKAGFSLKIGKVEGHFLHHLVVSDLHLQARGQTTPEIEVERFTLRWRAVELLQRRLHVELLLAEGVVVAPGPRATPPDAIEQAPQKPSIPDLSLPLEVLIDRLAVERLTLTSEDSETRLDLIEARISLLYEQWSIAGLKIRESHSSLLGDVEFGPAQPHPLDLLIRAQGNLPDQTAVQAELKISGPTLKPDIDLNVSEPSLITLDGVLDLDRIDPAFDLSGRWPDISWPLQGDPQYRSTAGELRLNGQTSDYDLQLTTALGGSQIPAAQLRLTGKGDIEHLRLQPLQLDTLDGRLDATGRVSWAPQLVWQLQVQATDINPGVAYPLWPGHIAAELQSQGQIRKGTPEFSVKVVEIGGKLREQALMLTGDLNFDGTRLLLKGVDLTAGDNHLRASGSAAETLNLKLLIDAPTLQQLYPGLAGTLKGEGKVLGSTQSPIVNSRLQGKDLAFQGQRLDQLTLEIDWQGQGGSVQLQADNLISSGLALNQIKASFDGPLEAHKLDLKVEGEDLGLELVAEGAYAEQAWQGSLNKLGLQQNALGEWLNSAPASLALGLERAEIGPFCLKQQGTQDTQLCLDGGWQKSPGLDLRGQLTTLELEPWSKFLPGEALLEGQLNADFAASGALDNPSAQFKIRSDRGRLQLPSQDEPLELAYRNTRIDGNFADDQGKVDLNFELGDNGVAQGAFTLGAGSERALGGQLKAQFPDLRLVSGFVPALEAVSGLLEIDLGLDGTLAAPLIKGDVKVNKATARVVAAGLELQDIELLVRGDGSGSLSLDASLMSGDGKLVLDGQIDPTAAQGPQLDIKIQGKDFLATRLPEAEVRLSPDLQITGAGPYHVAGSLLIPEAKIELNDVPQGAVGVSDDEIIVGQGAPAQAEPTASNVSADVRIEFGDKVSFSGFGLISKLGGALEAIVNQRVTRVDGKIELQDAAYKAYGQDLTVEQGRLIFAGPPGNPDLDLRAVRESSDGEVKAYLAMSGPLSKPRPRIYSEPALAEAEALSYLLTGKGLDRAGGAEGFNIANAALAFGIGKSDPLLQNLGNRLGLDEVRLESGANALEDSSLVVGKYLNPDLYLGYSQGLFNPSGSILLRLKLSEHLELESRAGEEQEVDLFYRIEHD